MCNNYFVWRSQQAIAEEYDVQVAEKIDPIQLFSALALHRPVVIFEIEITNMITAQGRSGC